MSRPLRPLKRGEKRGARLVQQVGPEHWRTWFAEDAFTGEPLGLGLWVDVALLRAHLSEFLGWTIVEERPLGRVEMGDARSRRGAKTKPAAKISASLSLNLEET